MAITTFHTVAFILVLYAAILTTLTSSEDRKPPATGDGRSAQQEGDECELRVLIASHAPKKLTSPNHPQPYPSHADCRWLLTAPAENQTLAVRIVTLAIEPERECRLDSLRLYLGSSPEVSPPLGGPLCGRIEDRLLRTNASTVLLAFRSDAAYEEAGFEIEYFVDEGDAGAVCGADAVVGRGWLTSPGFPGPYPDGVDCWTVVGGADDGPVTLTFEWLDLEEGGEECSFDYVRLWDGNDTSAPPLAVLCGQSQGSAHFRSSSSSLLVHFHSDGTLNRKGFRAWYRTGRRRTSPPLGECAWEEGDAGGTFASPGYPADYPSLAHCSLRIVASDDSQRILVTIDSLLLEVDSNCSYDFLQIEDPSSQGGDPETFCGRLSEPRHLVSDGPELQVQFRSDDFVEFLGFKLRYEFFGSSPEEEEEQGQEDRERAAPFRFSSTPENATLESGSMHALHCATEHPNAKIRWLKEEVFLAGDSPMPGLKLLPNDTLLIESMGRHLVGTYTCVAVAPEGMITAKARLLSTEDEPPCKIELDISAPSDSLLEQGEFALFECLSAKGGGDDLLVVSWTKDGRPLEGHVTVLKNGYLFVDGVRPQDSGRYECSARDPKTGCEGRASASLEVRERTRTEDVCGKPTVVGGGNRSEHAKIVGGNDARKGAYPWQVMLWEPKGGAFCGATLLNERWISTAAHCLKRRSISLPTIRILLGKHDRERREETEVETRIADSAHAVVYHPDFDGRTYDNDLALVRMRRRISFTDYVMPVCLGDRRLSERLLEGGARMGWVTGWGQLKEKGPSPRYLQEIKVPVVDQEVCRASTPLTVTRNMFCAGYSQEVIGDACHGDSGGPFLVRNEEDGRWYMVGVVSWGEGCGKTGKYGFYTKVANHLAWIQGIIKS